jgi:CheY-like chemotaxis protein
MHALVIEDDPVIAMFIEDELRDLGFNSVDTACTEQEAIAAVSSHCPDLITSDVSLLASTGAGAIRRIRPALAVPMIFITGDPEAARACLPDAQVIEKPFSVAQLTVAIEQLFSRPREVRRALQAA